jgi:hypothetical protein
MSNVILSSLSLGPKEFRDTDYHFVVEKAADAASLTSLGR